MSLSLTNRDDIIANSYSLITSDGVVNLIDAAQLSLVGAAPTVLNTIEKLSGAISNDPFFSASIDEKLAAKADTSAVFEKTVLPGTETLKMLNKKITSTEKFGENKLTITLQDSVGVVTDGWFDGFSVELDTITKQVKCTAAGDLFIGTTNVLTTLNSKASTTALNLKANTASPQFTGTGTFANLAVSTQLLVGIVDVMATLNNKAPLRNPSFLGTVACEDATTIGGVLTVSGARDNITSNITNTQLNGSTSLCFNNTSGASASEVGRIFCGQSAGLNLCTNTTHPIKFTTYTNDVSVAPASMQILGTGTRDVEIIAPLKIKCLQTTIEQAVVIGGAAPAEAIGLYVSNNGIINGNLTVVGNLTVNGFTSAKPYASLRVLTSTAAPAVASTGTTSGTIGTPGTTTVTQYGFLTNVSLARGTTGTTNLFQYIFTLPTAHPLGTNYIVNGGFQTSSSTSASPNAFLTFNVTSSTTFTVWVRSSAGVLMDGNFYVYTVP